MIVASRTVEYDGHLLSGLACSPPRKAVTAVKAKSLADRMFSLVQSKQMKRFRNGASDCHRN